MSSAIGSVDLIILAVYMGAVVLSGFFIGRGSGDPKAYLLADRKVPWWAILGSIVATETSTVTFLSIPGIAFAAGGDLRFLQLAMGFILGRILVALILLPAYFRGDLFTAYEVLHQRFGGATKQAASVLFLVARNLGDGLRLFLTAIVLEKVAGIDLALCIVVIGIATMVYTFFGGMKAVVWNDCAQFLVYITGGILAFIMILHFLPGGWQDFSAYAIGNNKLRLFDFRLDWTDSFTFWAGLFGGAVLTLGTHGTDQMMVQRYLCTGEQRNAAKALVVSGFVVFAQFALFLFLGIALACFYSQLYPDTSFERNDEVFATFIVTRLPTGLVGITLAAVFSAAMSTLSSSLSSSATSAVNDLCKPMMKSEPSPKSLVSLSRVLVVVFGVIQIAVAIVASYISRSVVSDALAIAGFTVGILLGLYFLGILTTRVKQTDALLGMIPGVGALTYVKFGTEIAWPWYPIIGVTTTFCFGYICSLVRGAQGRE